MIQRLEASVYKKISCEAGSGLGTGQRRLGDRKNIFSDGPYSFFTPAHEKVLLLQFPPMYVNLLIRYIHAPLASAH